MMIPVLVLYAARGQTTGMALTTTIPYLTDKRSPHLSIGNVATNKTSFHVPDTSMRCFQYVVDGEDTRFNCEAEMFSKHARSGQETVRVFGVGTVFVNPENMGGREMKLVDDAMVIPLKSGTKCTIVSHRSGHAMRCGAKVQ